MMQATEEFAKWHTLQGYLPHWLTEASKMCQCFGSFISAGGCCRRYRSGDSAPSLPNSSSEIESPKGESVDEGSFVHAVVVAALAPASSWRNNLTPVTTPRPDVAPAVASTCTPGESAHREADSGRGLPCWSLECLERLCESVCAMESRRVSAAVVGACWRAAVVGSPSASDKREIDNSLRALQSTLRDHGLSSGHKSATRRHKSVGFDADVASWLHALVRASPHSFFFEAVQDVLSASHTSALTRLSNCLVLLAQTRHNGVSSQDAAPPPLRPLPYQTLVCAVAEAAQFAEAGYDDSNLDAACNPSIAAAPAVAKLRADANAYTGTDMANEVAAGKTTEPGAFASWVDATIRLLPGHNGVISGQGMSLDAFACAALGRRAFAVSLNCYDVATGAESLASRLFLGLDGIWHSGLVVHRRELWYGGRVHWTRPGKSPFGAPSSKVALGWTLWTRKEVINTIRADLMRRFTVEGYDVLSLNCNDFCDALSLLLLGRHIPEDLRKQAETARQSPFVQLLRPLAKRYGLNSSCHSGSENASTALTGTVITNGSSSCVDGYGKNAQALLPLEDVLKLPVPRISSAGLPVGAEEGRSGESASSTRSGTEREVASARRSPRCSDHGDNSDGSAASDGTGRTSSSSSAVASSVGSPRCSSSSGSERPTDP